MADRFWRQGPLSHLGLAGRPAGDRATAGVALSECPFRVMIVVRGAADRLDEMESVIGLAPPTQALQSVVKDSISLLWLGPDEWLLVADHANGTVAERLVATLRAGMAGPGIAIVDVSDSYAVIGVNGANVRDLLAKGCPLDLHPAKFQPGQVAQTVIGRADVVLHQIDDMGFEIYVRRSFAQYLWLWLEDAGREFGVALAAG